MQPNDLERSHLNESLARIFPNANLDASYIDDPHAEEDDHFIDLNNEEKLNEAIRVLDEKLEKVKGDRQVMKIGNKEFKLADKDPIYTLAGPIDKQIRLEKCRTCQDVFFKKESQIIFCEFCGYSNCENCCYKAKYFPGAPMNDNT